MMACRHAQEKIRHSCPMPTKKLTPKQLHNHPKTLNYSDNGILKFLDYQQRFANTSGECMGIIEITFFSTKFDYICTFWPRLGL